MAPIINNGEQSKYYSSCFILFFIFKHEMTKCLIISEPVSQQLKTKKKTRSIQNLIYLSESLIDNMQTNMMDSCPVRRNSFSLKKQRCTSTATSRRSFCSHVSARSSWNWTGLKSGFLGSGRSLSPGGLWVLLHWRTFLCRRLQCDCPLEGREVFLAVRGTTKTVSSTRSMF